MFFNEDMTAVIIDNGFEIAKAGFAGDDATRSVFPLLLKDQNIKKTMFVTFNTPAFYVVIQAVLSLNCPNDWTCNICKKSGHKQSECEEPFSDNNNEHNENESTNTDDDNTDSETDDNNNDEAAHAQQHESEVEQMQEMPNEQSQETLTRDLKKTQNKNSQKVPIHQSQPPFQSITNEENDECTGEAATSSSKKAKKKSSKKKTTCQNDSKDEKQSSMQQFLVEKQTSATTPGNKVSKRSATTPTTDLFDRENQTTKPKTQS
ncbi:unnamed protein product [Mytilus edulis]|uniref:Uncharacterized protein n=1 Tax=Mytilus edulis TaxID=6550 RepID=A0A8S3UPF1_MYTED|nr:unnamed protein product [Mytilus edulis]